MIITNERIAGNFSYENGEYKVSGDFKVNPETKKMETLNSSVLHENENIGTVNAYKSGDEIRYNYNEMTQENVTPVASVIESLVSELEARYANVALMSN